MIGLIILLGFGFIIYAILNEFSKTIENQENIENDKKYLYKTKAKIKFVSEDTLLASYQNVIIYIFENYLIALSPSSEGTGSINVVFYKSTPTLSKLKVTSKAQISYSYFSDNQLTMTTRMRSLTLANFSIEKCDCYIQFQQIDDRSKQIILNFI